MLDFSLADIAAQLGGELFGDAQIRIRRIAPIEDAGPDAITFVANPQYAKKLAQTQAGCVIAGPALADQAKARGACLIAPDPYFHFARLTQWWAAQLRQQRGQAHAGPLIHPSAVIEPGARLHATARIGALAYVGAGAEVAEGVVIGPQSHVGEGARIGAGTRLAAHVTFGDACVIGARGILHSGAVIGADGFGFAPHQGRYEKIEQLGAVVMGDDVDIGANTCVDRGALSDTVIDDGVKLDNLIQIAHNVRIGQHTAMAGNVGVAGSARIGAFCTIGGAANILGHLELADHVHISVASVVTRSILKPGHYSGIFPIDDNASWEKNAATLRQLHTLRDRIRALEKKSS